MKPGLTRTVTAAALVLTFGAAPALGQNAPLDITAKGSAAKSGPAPVTADPAATAAITELTPSRSSNVPTPISTA